MPVSFAARQRLRQTMHNTELADEIIQLLDVATANSSNYTQSFVIADWMSNDSGDTYSLTINHNLNTNKPMIEVIDDSAPNEIIELHKKQIVNANTIVLKVTQNGADARFNGRVTIDV